MQDLPTFCVIMEKVESFVTFEEGFHSAPRE